MHSALSIANYFVQAAIDDGLATKDFPPAKVHGLVYLAHGWLLGSAGAAIFKGQVMADRDGIFVPELKEAGCWGTKNVTQLLSMVQLDERRGVMVEQTPQLAPNNPLIDALAWAWKTYGTLSSFRIGEHIKETGSPWERIWHADDRKGDEPRPVPNPMIRTWFRSLTSKRAEQGRHSKLTQTQKLEKKPRFDRTMQLHPKK
jgi:uncharacterized phage-associated protein